MSIFIAHHGIKGQRWGVRRFENEDGTLTAAGKRRYDSDGPSSKPSRIDRRLDRERKARNETQSGINYMKSLNKSKHVSADERSHNNRLRYEMEQDRTIQNGKIATLKAKKDPNYAKSKEYANAIAAAGREKTRRFLMGSEGSARATELARSMHMSQKQADRKVAGQEAVKRLIIGGAIGASLAIGAISLSKYNATQSGNQQTSVLRTAIDVAKGFDPDSYKRG